MDLRAHGGNFSCLPANEEAIPLTPVRLALAARFGKAVLGSAVQAPNSVVQVMMDLLVAFLLVEDFM